MDGSKEERYRAGEDALWQRHGVSARTEHRVEVPALGFKARVQEVGDPGGPPIVFLHGSPNCGTVWAPLVTRLKDFRCLIVDGPGYGLSEAPPRPLAAREHAIPVLAALNQLGVERAHIVGSSYGSCVAMSFIAAHPERVGRVIHQSHPGIVPDQPGYGAMFYFRFFSAMAWLKVAGATATSTIPLWRAIGHGPAIDNGRFAEGVLDWYASLLTDTGTLAADAGLTRAVLRGISLDTSCFVTREELARCQSATAWFWGEHETLGGMDVARQFAAMVPGSTVELAEGAGHLPWLDVPDAAEKHLRAFLTA